MAIVNLQDDPIFVRSPYIIVVDEPLQIEAQVLLYIWNMNDVQPTGPTYTLQKKIPAPDLTELSFNISNYVREHIDWIFSDVNYNVNLDEPNDNEWCYVAVSTWAMLDGQPFEIIDLKTYKAFDGYGYYEDGYNPVLSKVLLGEGTYDYLYDAAHVPSLLTPSTQTYEFRYGELRFIPTELFDVHYTDLVTGTTYTMGITAGNIEPVTTIFLVYPSFAANGNLIEYKDNLGVVLWSATIRPKQECKFTVVTVDFVNRYGAWQRTFFYKTSKRSMAITKKEYNLYKRDLINYNTSVPQRSQFNVNAKKTVSVNSDWVDESYNELVLKPLMLSEEIRINKLPAKLLTKKTEMFEHINKHLINYKLDFEYSFDVINDVV